MIGGAGGLDLERVEYANLGGDLLLSADFGLSGPFPCQALFGVDLLNLEIPERSHLEWRNDSKPAVGRIFHRVCVFRVPVVVVER